MWPYCEQENDWLSKQPTPVDVIAKARLLRAAVLADLAKRGWLVLSTAVAPVSRFFARQRLAQDLQGMSDLELADIGLHRGDIDAVLDGSYQDPRMDRAVPQPITVRMGLGAPREAANAKSKDKAAA